MALIEKIDAYLQGTLSENETAAFEQALEHDADLCAAVKAKRLENTPNQNFKIPEFVSKARPSQKIGMLPDFSALKSLKLSPKQWLSVVGLTLLLAALGFYFMTTLYSNRVLLTGAYEKSRNILRGDKTAVEPSTEALFGNQKNTKSVQDYEKARIDFQKIVDDPNAMLTDIRKAEWQIVLCYLSMNKTDAPFQELVNRIAKSQTHPFYLSAIELRNKIETVWWRLSH